MMQNYNISIRNGIHTIKVTLQQWDYIGHIIYKIGGNCHGKDIMNFDFECESDFPENDCDLVYHEDDDFFSARLKDKDGNILIVEEDAEGMNKMIVGIEIIDYQEETEINGN